MSHVFTLNQSDSSLPVITLITAVHNNVDHIKGTLESVLSQSYPHIEYIVIDGNSNDGTVEILEEFRDDISVLVSGGVRIYPKIPIFITRKICSIPTNL